MSSMVWFKRDIRTHDHPALWHACQHEQDVRKGVIAVYIIDKEMWHKNDNSDVQIAFILSGVRKLMDALRILGISLIVLSVENTDSIPQTLHALAEQYNVSDIFWNREDEFNESKRDCKVKSLFTQNGLSCHVYCDQLIFDTPLIQTESSGHFRVYTPFKRKWLKVFQAHGMTVLSAPKPVQFTTKKSHITLSRATVIENMSTMVDPTGWPAGEEMALKNLKQFCRKKLFSYDADRNTPSLDGTSQLSPYLATGMLSPKVCFKMALQANQGETDSGNKGAVTFMSELIWREFYRHILVHFPHVCKGKPFLLSTEKIRWDNIASHLKAWENGQTGFPLVDAGMRQLNLTGWMHNRLRMITAMFLSKNLLIDWRYGERYFARHLVDFDFSSNNGGWQWCASTGTDASPWFRVFNPVLQSQRFDPSGKFIRQYCPELAGLSERDIHQPWRAGYPAPIVDLAASRKRVLAEFALLKEK